ncbi:MAG: hypothetical protein JST73_05930 [Actinobacteria bacterium]|nr:hypothetical protein [Actinomycetota bacterium]
MIDDTVALMDQGSFLGLRALGHQPCFLGTWTYRRPVDLDALERFNHALASTLLGRLVEVSPLPGGRHRWVRIAGSPPIEIEPAPRDRSEIFDWTDEFAERPVDPETGPGWRLGVLELTDGGTAIAIVIPHTLGDGLCVLQALADAVRGEVRLPAYPMRGERNRREVRRDDLRSALRGVPGLARAIPAAIRVARSTSNRTATRSARGRSTSGVDTDSVTDIRLDEPFRVPAACVRVCQGDWDAVAKRLGGTSNTLVSAFASRIGAKLGRVGTDGNVTLAVPVSVRVEGDTRANALDGATIRVDPSGLDRDLVGLRAATKAALIACADRSGDLEAALPLAAVTPRFVVRWSEATAMGADALPVGCSNYGDLPAATTRIDGSDCDDFWVRLVEPGTTRSGLDRIGGQCYVLSGRVLGSVFLSTIARPVGGCLDHATLLRRVAETLAEFGLAPESAPL